MSSLYLRDDFNAHECAVGCIDWVKDYFDKNGQDCNAVIGISGGKDSTVVAALCVEALGNDRVIGVLMPNGIQDDIDDARLVANLLGIRKYEFNIQDIYNRFIRTIRECEQLDNNIRDISDSTVVNLPPRIRMSMLFAISQSMNGRVANTCNLSEDYVGYATLFGDSAGQFAPLARMTRSEVVAVGDYLFDAPVLANISKRLLHKEPADGLCGKTDEDNLGFTYYDLDKYLRTGECSDDTLKIIYAKHEANLHKCHMDTDSGLNMIPIPGFDTSLPFFG